METYSCLIDFGAALRERVNNTKSKFMYYCTGMEEIVEIEKYLEEPIFQKRVKKKKKKVLLFYILRLVVG